jgi:7-cyano-7-deazaguanine synthase
LLLFGITPKKGKNAAPASIWRHFSVGCQYRFSWGPALQKRIIGKKRSKHGKVWILLSGGLDSTACVAFYQDMRFSIEGIFIDYGQVAAKMELRSAKAISKHYQIPLRRLKWAGLQSKGMGLIVGRNMFLLAAAIMELPLSSGILAMGIHAGTDYPDCTPHFVKRVQSIFDLYSKGQIQIGTPFLKWNKKDIWEYALAQKVPVGLIYSCECGSERPCGQCLSCLDREALHACS